MRARGVGFCYNRVEQWCKAMYSLLVAVMVVVYAGEGNEGVKAFAVSRMSGIGVEGWRLGVTKIASGANLIS